MQKILIKSENKTHLIICNEDFWSNEEILKLYKVNYIQNQQSKKKILKIDKSCLHIMGGLGTILVTSWDQ